MSDLYVRAWNEVDAEGTPILVIDEAMTFAEYDRRCRGQFAGTCTRLLRAITFEELDALLERDLPQ